MLINSDLLLSFSTFRNIVDKIKIEKFYIDKINLNETHLSVRCQSHVQFWTKSIFPTWSSYNITFSSYEYTASFWIQHFFNYREKCWSVLAHKYGRRCLYFLICEAERGLRQTWFSTLHTLTNFTNLVRGINLMQRMKILNPSGSLKKAYYQSFLGKRRQE